MIKFDSKENYDLIDDNDYEVELKADIQTLPKSGRRVINCKFTIRKDVQQAFGGRSVFDNIWSDKSDNSKFDHIKIQKLLLTQDPEKGKFDFEDYEELVQFINGFLLRIHISKKEPDEYHTEAYNEVKYLSYAKSQAQPKVLGGINREESNTTAIEIDDDDFPF